MGCGGCKQKSGQSKEGKKLFQKRSAMTEKKRNKRGPGKAESKREDDEERAQHVWDDLGRRTKASAALRPDRRPQFERETLGFLPVSIMQGPHARRQHQPRRGSLIIEIYSLQCPRIHVIRPSFEP